jgi:hypothetical protein
VPDEKIAACGISKSELFSPAERAAIALALKARPTTKPVRRTSMN